MLPLLFEEMMNEEKKYTLTPDWKYYFLAYLICILTIPLLIGIIGLYFVRKHHKSIQYIITDEGIIAKDAEYQQKVDLINIENIEITRHWLQYKFNVGTLIIHTSTNKMVLKGLKDPGKIKSLIEQAVEVLKKQAERETKPDVEEPNYAPGNMPKMNYLTGLWQQGLISEEDFEEERKHYE